MKKNILVPAILVLILFTSCIQTPNSDSQVSNSRNTQALIIPFNSMSFYLNGKTQKRNQAGKIIFEKSRIVMQGGNSKEAFTITRISQADNILTFQTENNKNEKFKFIFILDNDNIIKVDFNMFDMDGYFNTDYHQVTKSKLLDMYKDQISDCNCNKTNRADGVVVYSCDPLPVASDNNLSLGLSLMSSNSLVYGSISIRFINNNIKQLSGKIDIILENGNHISKKYINQQETIIGNSKVQLAIFEFSNSDIQKIRKNKVSVINFSFTDSITRAFEVKTNSDVFIRHYNCLLQ